MLNKILSAAIATALFATAAQATPKNGHPPRADKVHASLMSPIRSVDSVTGGMPVLYDQFTNASDNGVFINDSSSSFDSYDEEGADDFVVPGPNGWSVSEFDFLGFSSSGKSTTNAFASTVNLAVYPDAAGIPAAAPSCSYPGLSANYEAKTTRVSVVLPTACVLPAGHYWVALQAINDPFSGGLFLWTRASVQGNSPAVFQNPGDGEGTGCTSWTAIATCWTGSADPDFAFQVRGQVSTPVSLQSYSVD